MSLWAQFTCHTCGRKLHLESESHQKLEVYKKRGGEMGSAIPYIIYLMYWTWQPDLIMILSTSLNQLYISMQVA